MILKYISALYFKVKSLNDSVSEGTCDIFKSSILIVDHRFRKNLKMVLVGWCQWRLGLGEGGF